ncbi:alpha/beta hydrolase [Sphingobacterium paludis]|uniref:Alpha-beta hydrolase superfamily lysophospholipase n=1 Tax=Sphingobacterium paludis TaxID=1476465 RepID=A0A4R7D109_9SPHI|nr:alpha/beta fold hydrolase [Sphingobacterium paludis]TDS13164.1 alpha-beta hydrolase superfamily lysophospholipase [Sphingobacterium paludis]
MSRKIIFIHGMFQNPVSWTPWMRYFGEQGFDCSAPAWPDHEGEPKMLRTSPPDTLGDLSLEDVIQKLEADVIRAGGNDADTSKRPILIGHSVGGLIAQIFVARGLASMAVAICPVAPNKMMTLDWPFFKNVAAIANPFKGDKPFAHTAETFHESFCNTLNKEDAALAFELTATQDSRNVLRGCLGSAGEIDISLKHVPLLFISAKEDKIIPYELVEKNAAAYTDVSSIVTYKEFPDRSHFICGEPGSQEVIDHVQQWIREQQSTVPLFV